MSYFIVAILGAFLAVGYWYAVQKYLPPQSTQIGSIKEISEDSVKIIPDISKAKKETLVTSLDQFKNTPGLSDVSTNVPGYFKFFGGTATEPRAWTKSDFGTHYFASVHIIGDGRVNAMEFTGGGVWFGLYTNWNGYFIWESEEHWSNQQPLPVAKQLGVNTMQIYQNGRMVGVFLNDKLVATFRRYKEAKPGPIAVGFKNRATLEEGGSILFQKLSIWEFD